jgi:PhnB protein
MEPTRTPKLAPYLVAHDARGLVGFLEKGLGGRLSYEMGEPNGRLAHAEVRIADSLVMLADAPEGHPQFPAMVHLYVPDAMAAHDRAVRAGATSVKVPVREPDGDLRGGVQDRWGNQWWFTTPPGGA